MVGRGNLRLTDVCSSCAGPQVNHMAAFFAVLFTSTNRPHTRSNRERELRPCTSEKRGPYKLV